MSKYCFYLAIQGMCLFTSLIFCKEKRYSISGMIEGLGDEMVYLADAGAVYFLKDQKQVVDSCLSSDGSFSFSGKINELGLYRIDIPKLTKQYLLFVLEDANIEIQGDIRYMYRASVSGSRQHDLYSFYNNNGSLKSLTATRSSLADSIYKYVGVDSNMHFMFSRENRLVDQKIREHNLMFIKNHPGAYVSLKLINELFLSSNISVDTIEMYYHGLDTGLKNSRSGIVVNRRIHALKLRGAKRKVPDFNALDIHEKAITPEKYRGKYLVIDFWATWCIPCIEQLPELRQINALYGDSFNILSISLDRDRDLCKRFITSNQMDWDNICDGLAGRSDIAVDFNIMAIPRAFVCDSEGYVIYDSAYSDIGLIRFVEELNDMSR